MVTEHAVITVATGDEAAFEAAFADASRHIAGAPGCLGLRLLRGIEAPGRYLLLVEWASLEAHTEGFRSSPAFGAWRAGVSPFFAEPPAVEHFADAR